MQAYATVNQACENAAIPKAPSPMQEALHRLDSAVIDATAKFEQLIYALVPVTRQEPTTKDGSAQLSTPAPCDMAEQLRLSTARLEVLASVIAKQRELLCV